MKLGNKQHGQEVLHYLSRMLAQWCNILGDITPNVVTPQAVSALQLRAPAESKTDARAIKDTMNLKSKSYGGQPTFKIFPGVQERDQRQGLVDRLCSCSRILSFHTFFEDTIYVEVCHSSLRTLLPSRQAYSESFELAFSNLYGKTESLFQTSYLHLWLYAMRHFPELSSTAAAQPRKEKGRPKSVNQGPRQGRIRAFAAFASNLGFQVSLADFGDAGEVLPLDIDEATQPPPTTTDLVDVPMKARCNRPLSPSYETDRKYLFMKYISTAVNSGC